MDEQKLTRATVPMCPECGGEVEMQGASFCGPPGAYCGTCDGYDYPNYGYYPDETAREVARELEAWALRFLRGLPIQSDALGFAARLKGGRP